MQIEDQSAVIDFLADPRTYGLGAPVDVIETHISVVFLAGTRAFKLKRAVRLPYADFSTADIRFAACKKELRLNRATTPELYLGVRRITREGGELRFDGYGELVDSVVEMLRFDDDDLLDRVARRGALTAAMIASLADVVIAAHAGAEIRKEGGRANIAAVLDINRAGFGESHLFTGEEVARIDTAFRKRLRDFGAILDARASRGMIRRCHGDLHLRNICLFRGRPRLFDCIDFNDRLATSDVLYDLAFLAMDLWHRGLAGFASLAVNRYFDGTDQDDGYVLMPFFMGLRSAVRAHVIATQAGETAASGLVDEARAYYDLALSLLRPRPPVMIAIGGLSGSGKSTVAEALAPRIGPPPGARLIESDRIRKAMFGVSPETRLPETAYDRAVSDRVYAEMAARSGALAVSGATVVADAVFDDPARRKAISDAAASGGIPFAGFWLEADPALLKQRVARRAGGASDADLGVLERQLARHPDGTGWTGIDNSGPLERTVADILSRIADRRADDRSGGGD